MTLLDYFKSTHPPTSLKYMVEELSDMRQYSRCPDGLPLTKAELLAGMQALESAGLVKPCEIDGGPGWERGTRERRPRQEELFA